MPALSIPFLLFASWLFVACGGLETEIAVPEPALDPIRISYPTDDGVVLWGMVGQALERTDILAQHGFEGVFIHCQDSPDLLWSMVYGDCDAALITTGVMGSAAVSGRDFSIVSALGGGGRIALMVPTESPVKSIKDLKGKTVENPILGGLLERFLSMENLEPDAVRAIPRYRYDGSAERDMLAGRTDAIMHWDPYVETLVSAGKARILVHDPYHLELMMLKTYLNGTGGQSGSEGGRDQGVRFMMAVQHALYFVLRNPERTAGWYSSVSRIPRDQVMAALPFVEVYTHFEPEHTVADVVIAPTEHHIKDLEGVAGAMDRFGVFKDIRNKVRARRIDGVNPDDDQVVDIRAMIDMELPEAAQQRWAAAFELADKVEVTNPNPVGPFARCRGRHSAL